LWGLALGSWEYIEFSDLIFFTSGLGRGGQNLKANAPLYKINQKNINFDGDLWYDYSGKEFSFFFCLYLIVPFELDFEPWL
jgi:hypothetical protein